MYGLYVISGELKPLSQSTVMDAQYEKEEQKIWINKFDSCLQL
jgi:hypothetical protein